MPSAMVGTTSVVGRLGFGESRVASMATAAGIFVCQLVLLFLALWPQRSVNHSVEGRRADNEIIAGNTRQQST